MFHFRSTVLGRPLIIGLKRVDSTQDGFVWEDGTPLGDYTNWADNEPINTNNCALLAAGTTAYWESFSCAGTFWLVCQREASKYDYIF